MLKELIISVLISIVGVSASAQQPKEWTLLVFISGHDSVLDAFGFSDIKEMEKVGSSKDVNIIVQRGTLKGSDTVRYYIEKSKDPSSISSPIVESFPRVDMGDFNELSKFIEWGVKKYPAKRYFIDVWNHGSGWRSLDTNIKKRLPEDIGYDELSGNKITTEQMGLVMKRFSDLIGKKVDIYGSDACLMNMAEVAAEMSDSVQFFVGSQEDEPLEGWPYHSFLKKMVQNPTAEASAVGVMLAQSYKQYYEDVGNRLGTTFAVVDLSFLDAFMDQVSRLSKALINLNQEKLKKVYYYAVGTENFSLSDYKDFFHFFDKLKKDKALGIDTAIINDIETLRHNLIVYNVNSDEHINANGLSIWLPTYGPQLAKNSNRYTGLVFQQKTNWLELINTLIQFESSLEGVSRP